MKNKIKKLKLPLSKMTEAEKDYTAVLLEDVNSNMKAFLNVLSREVVTNEKPERLELRVIRIEKNLNLSR